MSARAKFLDDEQDAAKPKKLTQRRRKETRDALSSI